jgi:hypothetical protein
MRRAWGAARSGLAMLKMSQGAKPLCLRTLIQLYFDGNLSAFWLNAPSMARSLRTPVAQRSPVARLRKKRTLRVGEAIYQIDL